MLPLTKQELNNVIKQVGIADITTATIRQICSLAGALEKVSDSKFVHLEIGNPGLPAASIGIEAECKALHSGIANQYPNIAGTPELKENASEFLKAFMNVEVPPRCIIPTVGSMQGSFSVMTLLAQRDKKKDTMLFLNPGFSVQRNQANLIGLKSESFDIYDYRGAKLEQKLESILNKGNITGIIYSNPNNPAWFNLTDEELEIIGRLATKYDAIVVEDLAYLGMDFRRDYSVPYEAPFIPAVAKYTDNYILLVSASKIFSYAGQRIGLVCMSQAVADSQHKDLQEFYHMSTFVEAYIFGILYCMSSGTSHSAQYALAAMLKAATDKKLDFVGEAHEYGRRAAIAKKMFTDNGFHIIYDKDGEEPISDGFFFTVGYGKFDSAELQSKMMQYGISSVSLPSMGSEQPGLRVCVSMLNNEEVFQNLQQRLESFHKDHQGVTN